MFRFLSRKPTAFCCRRYLATSPSTNVNLRIVFGSQSGTAEAFANELDFDAQEANIKTELIDALNFSAKDLIPKAGQHNVTAFVMACYGEGEPTDNAKKFFKSLEETPMDGKVLQGAKYGVFGLGNSQCFRDRYNVIGKLLDKRLEASGGKRIIAMGLGDASPALEGSDSMCEKFAAWKQELISTISTMSDADSTTAAQVSTACSADPLEDSSKANDQQTVNASNTHHFVSDVPIALSARQQAMVPTNRMILQSTVSHVTQLFSKTDELTAAVEVEFDLPRTSALFPQSTDSLNVTNFTQGLQPGDHIGVFAPNSRLVVERFALAAGLSQDDLDKPVAALNPDNTSNDPTTLRQVLTWQTHLSGVASSTSIKLLQRWLKDQSNLTLTAALFSQLESNYESQVRDKGLDTATILDMIPKLPSATSGTTTKLPVAQLLKTLPTLNPRLYSITHMVLPSDRALASAAAANACPIAKQLQASIHSPTATDDYTKITLLCRLLRYRQTKSSANRVVDGVCSSFLTERLVPGQSEVAIFFRESNFHLPPPTPASSNEIAPPVIMISGGSGLAPFMSFLEERQRRLQNTSTKMGPAVLYFGCRTNDEYIFRDKLVSYLGTAEEGGDATERKRSLDRLYISFSTHQANSSVSTTESLHPHEILHPKEEHIPHVFKQDKAYYLSLLQQGAYVYVCGGAGQFGKAVREAINEVAIEAFNIPAKKDEHGKEVVHPGIRYLIDQKKYFEDLAD